MKEIAIPGGWRERVEDLVGRRKDVWLLVATIAVPVLFALVLWARNPPARVAPPATSNPGTQSVVSAGVAANVVIVHVSGAVKVPGLYEFPEGSRIADAIDSAGGPRAKADLDALNLAEILIDGAKVQVPAMGEVVPQAAPATGSGGDVAPVPINSADQSALEAVPGIGPVKAAAIVAHRDEIGGFTSLEQLLEVTGIGPATLESLRPYVTL